MSNNRGKLKKVYVVVKENLWRHEIIGVYDFYSLAVEKGEEACRKLVEKNFPNLFPKKPNINHSFVVLKYVLNETVEDEDLVCEIKCKKYLKSKKNCR